MSSCEYYDPKTDRWFFIAPMLGKRFGFGVGIINGQIYAVGGHPARDA